MSLSGKIETAANAATIVIAVLISIVLVKTYVLPKPASQQSSVVFVPDVVRGKKIDGHLMGVDWAKNHRTLVLAISTTCHFCKDSVPFYRKLGAAEKGVKTVAVLPQSIIESQQYLSDAGVHVDEVKQVSLNALGVRATPTLLLVDDSGAVTDVWIGKLQPDLENQVLTAVEKKIVRLDPDSTIP